MFCAKLVLVAVVLAIVVLVAYIAFVPRILTAQPLDTLRWEAQLQATEGERLEGYFSLGNDAVLLVKEGSSIGEWMRSHENQRIEIEIRVIP